MSPREAADGERSDDPDAGLSEDENRSSRRDREPEASIWRMALRDVAPFLDVGWRIAGATALPPLLGYAADAWLETTPWMVLVGCVLGLLAAGFQFRALGEELDRRSR
jgi:F0F1-type ATP synthase assembly protein I